MKFKKYSKIRHFIRDKILLPIANKLIGIKPHFIRITHDGVHYEARYYRTRYWWDNEPITIKGILDKRKVYHISCWDGGKEGRCWCEMFGYGNSMFYAENPTDAEIRASQELAHVIAMWLKYVVNPNKEKKDESTN